eukprot:GHUV01033242.1.p1 GENE.GHUV01033242.1~~GHUV01033242.1.p1  ORF type:complete len:132 (-),score=38.26 GHUV01033242.1:236-631(-)
MYNAQKQQRSSYSTALLNWQAAFTAALSAVGIVSPCRPSRVASSRAAAIDQHDATAVSRMHTLGQPVQPTVLPPAIPMLSLIEAQTSTAAFCCLLQLLLLENVRFYKEEEKNEPEFAKKVCQDAGQCYCFS